MDNGNTPFAVYLDLSKAFDTLNHSILLDKHNFYGFRGTSINLIIIIIIIIKTLFTEGTGIYNNVQNP